MKILFLTHPEEDYSEAMLFAGLCQELGASNVIDVPWKASYHGAVSSYHGFSRGHDEHAPIGVDAGIGDATGLGPYQWFPAQPGERRSETEIVDLVRSNAFEIVIVGTRLESQRHFRRLKSELRTKRIVFHESEDYWEIDRERAEGCGAKLYLKRELLPAQASRSWPFRLVSFPFACVLPPQDLVAKETDVSVVLSHTHADRKFAFEGVLSLDRAIVDVPTMGFFGESVPEHVRNDALAWVEDRWLDANARKYTFDEYQRSTARARIAVAPRGHGRDSVRRWEIPAFADTLLMSQGLDLVEPANPLVDGVHYATFASAGELREKLRHYLDHDDERSRIAATGHTLVMRDHSCAARARQLLQLVKEVYQ
jgi:hypothetical protein